MSTSAGVLWTGWPCVKVVRVLLVGASQNTRHGIHSLTQVFPNVADMWRPQGSVLGPILFILYTADSVGLVEQHGFRPHLYADNTQVYGSCRPSAVADFQVRLSACVNDVAAWMLANRLQLNTGKTNLLWYATARRCHQLPTSALKIKKSVRNLGIYFDANLSTRCHVQKTIASCFAILRQLRSIRRSVPTSVYQALVVALVLSRLDYGNAVLVGLPGYLYSRLQSVLNAAARSIAGLQHSDHITDTLANFHWLGVSERVQFKLATIVYRSLNSTAPSHLAADLRRLSDNRYAVQTTSAVFTDTPAGCPPVAVRNCW